MYISSEVGTPKALVFDAIKYFRPLCAQVCSRN